MMKNSFIEKTYVVGTHWDCLREAIPLCNYSINYVTENKKAIYKFTFSKYHVHCLISFKYPKLPISIKTPVTLLQIVYICMTASTS